MDKSKSGTYGDMNVKKTRVSPVGGAHATARLKLFMNMLRCNHVESGGDYMFE